MAVSRGETVGLCLQVSRLRCGCGAGLFPPEPKERRPSELPFQGFAVSLTVSTCFSRMSFEEAPIRISYPPDSTTRFISLSRSQRLSAASKGNGNRLRFAGRKLDARKAPELPFVRGERTEELVIIELGNLHAGAPAGVGDIEHCGELAVGGNPLPPALSSRLRHGFRSWPEPHSIEARGPWWSVVGVDVHWRCCRDVVRQYSKAGRPVRAAVNCVDPVAGALPAEKIHGAG
jgi:hypothetical protein